MLPMTDAPGNASDSGFPVATKAQMDRPITARFVAVLHMILNASRLPADFDADMSPSTMRSNRADSPTVAARYASSIRARSSSSY